MASTLRDLSLAEIVHDAILDFNAQPDETFLADTLAPRVDVRKQGGYWDREAADEEDLVIDDGRAPGQAPKEVRRRYVRGPVYVCEQRVLREEVTFEDHVHWASEEGINRAQQAGRIVARRLLSNREARVTAQFLSCDAQTRTYDAALGIYNNYGTQVIDLATYNPGSGAGDEQWNDANSDPGDFLTQKVEALIDLGTTPNTVIVPEKLWFMLRRNTAVKAEMADNRDVYPEGVLLQPELRGLQVIVYKRMEKLSGTRSNLMGNNVWLGQLDANYDEAWRGHVVQPVFSEAATDWPFDGQLLDEYGEGGMVVRIYGADDPGKRKYYVDVDAGYDTVLVPWNDNSKAGILLRNVAA